MLVNVYDAHGGDQPLELIHITRRESGPHDLSIEHDYPRGRPRLAASGAMSVQPHLQSPLARGLDDRRHPRDAGDARFLREHEIVADIELTRPR